MTEKSEKKQELNHTSKENQVGPPYSAITLDTCIFQKNSFWFEGGRLATLKSIAPIKVVFAEIVLREIRRQLEEEKEKISKFVRSAYKVTKRMNYFDSKAESELINVIESAEKIGVSETIIDYLNTQDALVVGKKHCEMETLIKLYFSGSPPFKGRGNKEEFPDAIALLSLEAWAKENKKRILAISNDDGWISFSEHSEYIDVFSDLEAGLNHIQEISQRDKNWVYDFIRHLNTGKYHNLDTKIDEYLRTEVDRYNAEIDYNNTESTVGNIEGHIYSVEYHDASLSFSNNQYELDLTFVHCTTENISFFVTGNIIVTAKAELEHYILGDEEYIDNDKHAGSSNLWIEEKVPVRLLFELERDIDQSDDSLNIIDLEIMETLQIPFGEVEPGEIDDDDFLTPDFSPPLS
jgi:hypothetical protein